MAVALQIFDETPSRKRIDGFTLEVASERLTVREVIERRVRAEVERHNSDSHPIFRGLVQPSNTEKELNGFAMRERRAVDADAQVEVAWRAFSRNGFLVLVGGQQVDSLDDEITLQGGTIVSFIKLVPLVGG